MRTSMRTFLLALSLLASAVTAQADTLKSETEIRQLTDKIMAQAGKGDIDGAYSTLAPYASADVRTLDTARIGARNARVQLEQYVGPSIGQEFIRSERVGDSLLKLVYIEKTAKQALPWQFIFYKSSAGWVLSAFRSGDDINSLFMN